MNKQLMAASAASLTLLAFAFSALAADTNFSPGNCRPVTAADQEIFELAPWGARNTSTNRGEMLHIQCGGVTPSNATVQQIDAVVLDRNVDGNEDDSVYCGFRISAANGVPVYSADLLTRTNSRLPQTLSVRPPPSVVGPSSIVTIDCWIPPYNPHANPSTLGDGYSSLVNYRIVTTP